MRFLIALAPLALLAGCGSDDAANETFTNQAPVAAAPAPAGQNWVDTVAKTPEGGYRQGNPNAPIKLVEYGSRSCPACANFATNGVEALREKYIATGQVSYEFRDFLLHGPQDLAASLAGRCVATEAYFPVLDQMFAEQMSFAEKLQALDQATVARLQSLTPAQQASELAVAGGYLDFIKQRGVPEAKARQCLADQKLVGDLTKSFQHGQQEMKVQGTPTFFINGTQVQNTVRWQELEPALQAAGAR